VVAAALAGLLIGLAFRAALADATAIVAATRAVGYLLLAAAVVVFIVVPSLRRVSDEQVALYLEEQAPELRQVMISAIGQLRDEVARGASPALYRRVIQQAIAEIDRLERGAAVERPRTRRALLRFGALAAVAVVLVGFGPVAVRDMARILFVPWSRAAAATIPALSVSPGDVSVPRGASLDIRAELRALNDHGAVIVVEPDSSAQATTLPMIHDSTGVAYVVRLFDINRPTRYHVEAGGLRSPTYRIAVTDLPTVRQLSLELHYPAYTHLPPQRIENGGDVVAVTGTRAAVEITATLPIRGGSLRFDDGSVVPLAMDSTGALSGSFRVAHDGFYRVDLIGSDGSRVPGSVQHSVEALVDHPPTVRIEKPGRDTRVTAVEEVPLSIRAGDDYGVTRVELHYSINGGADHVVALTDSTHRSSLDFSAIHALYLDELSLKVGALVAYHAVARDGAGNTG
ncbi:MAG: DUF4175 family protein, partial [Gemmatimonadales bacterium]